MCKLIRNFHFTDNTLYELPDKTNVVVGQESTEIPELIFQACNNVNKEYPGVQHMLGKVCDMLVADNKREPISSLILTGGATNMKSFFERFQNEIYTLNGDLFDSCRSRFYFCNSKVEKLISSWTSAAIIASMKSFENMVITRQEYEEHGFSLIERKLI